ncbi:DUF3883 domain-containing protein [Acidimangrovimonas sediminis]|uniref:DUF3883 domain-containing protein n=1 Tax=Acidimangrovimonas sediminis TaxID=2056283 RepID=UPI000C80B25E|nr:DUF3883 domain-containing protein [Acidimangrovimonas sediminis]
MSGDDWTDLQNDAIVADYFAMLGNELAGRPYNKAAHNRALQEATGRTKGSIEFKHQNISAVLVGLGETWIQGYKPAFNFQTSLIDAVARWLQNHRGWLARVPPSPPPGLAEPRPIWIGVAPTMRNAPPPKELEQMQAVARRFDVAARDERNRALGQAGEAHVYHHERSILMGAGREDLAKRIEWVSRDRGDGAGFDIASFAPDGARRLIEVKTTNGWDRTPFHISRNELAVADERRESWILFRLYNFSREPRAFELRPPLDAHVSLTPTTFQAGFR